MILRITLPLLRGERSNLLDGYPMHEEIQKCFRVEGLSLTNQLDEQQKPAKSYELEAIHPVGEIVPTHSTKHYKDLAAKNYGKDTEISFAKEIMDYTIFFGVSTSTRSSWIVTRTSNSEITVMIINTMSVRKSLETFERHIGAILAFPFIDEKSALDRSIEFHTISKKAHSLTGYLTRKRLIRSFLLNPVETGIALLSLLLLLTSYGLQSAFPAQWYDSNEFRDPLPQLVRLTMSIPHIFFVSFLTSVTTVLIKHWFVVKKNFVRWEK